MRSVANRRSRWRPPRAALILAAMAGVTVSAPSSSRAERTGKVASPIVAGKDDVPGQGHDAVVQLRLQPDGDSVKPCSAILVAPNLVATARHCLTVGVRVAECAGVSGRVEFPPLQPPEAVFIIPGMTVASLSEPPPPEAVYAKQLVAESSSDVCSNDIAFVILEKDVPDVLPASIRFESPPVVDEAVTAVGFGVSTPLGEFPAVRQMKDTLRVEAYYSATSNGPVGNGVIQTGPANCAGDSGGGLFSQRTGAVIGLVQSSYSNNTSAEPDPAAPFGECFTGASLFASFADHVPLIVRAFTLAGHAPLREGKPAPAAFGSDCTDEYDCKSLLCAFVGGSGTCAEACPESGVCASGGACRQIEASSVCLAVSEGRASDGACSLQPSPSVSASPLWFACLPAVALTGLVWRSRRRVSKNERARS